MKKIFFLLVLFMSMTYSYGNGTPFNDDKHPAYIEIVNKSGWFTQNILGLASLLISSIALAQLIYARMAIHQDVKNRNLSYLSELDRMLIEDPKLWQFYDEDAKDVKPAKNGDDPVICEGKLKAFIYYKLNHFEITLTEENMSPHTAEAWNSYMIYCLQSSSRFTKEVESILLEKGYKGLFGPLFVLKLAIVYKEAFKQDSRHNTESKKDADFMDDIKKVISERETVGKDAEKEKDYFNQLLNYDLNDKYKTNFEYFGKYEDDVLGHEKPIERIIKYYMIKTKNWKKDRKLL